MLLYQSPLLCTSQASPNLAKVLSEGNPVSDVTPPDPAPATKKSSNSQLFKSTEFCEAIPLTFNNSIAEVLAASSKPKLGITSFGMPFW